MKPSVMIGRITEDGVAISLSHEDAIKLKGPKTVVKRWLPVINEQKPQFKKALLEIAAVEGDLPEIRAWLIFIGEHDPQVVDDVLTQCRDDPDARAYFSRRSMEVKE